MTVLFITREARKLSYSFVSFSGVMGMIAVIQTGGKQYKVSEGDEIQVEKLDGNVGESI